jgi:formate-dependent nitrite reductase membrane component NrfD
MMRRRDERTRGSAEEVRRPGEEVRETIPPVDGRNIDPEIGALMGEGALQRVRDVNAPPHGEASWIGPPPSDVPDTPVPTYYGVPALKEPVWKWYISAYFYAGGVAGACAALGAAAERMDGREMEALSRRCRLIAAGGAVASAGLLIADLGRPARFLDMLRVLRPSSPMNVGTWILSAFGACAGLAALPVLLPVPRIVRRVAGAASIGAGLLGLPLTAYTGVLLAGTAVPLWQGARRALPILFACSAAASASSVLDLLPTRGRASVAVHRFGAVAKAAEVALTVALERQVAAAPRVALPLRSGATGALWRAAQGLFAASAVTSLVPGGHRRLRAFGGLLGTAGAVALRFALLHAGRRSARDPRATFEQQRAGRGAREVPELTSPRRHPEMERSGSTEGGERGFQLTDRGRHL